jgi:hypothetical protein
MADVIDKATERLAERLISEVRQAASTSFDDYWAESMARIPRLRESVGCLRDGIRLSYMAGYQQGAVSAIIHQLESEKEQSNGK